MTQDMTKTVDGAAARGTPDKDNPLGPMGYELLEEIGRGGMGIIYRAHETALGRYVPRRQARKAWMTVRIA